MRRLFCGRYAAVVASLAAVVCLAPSAYAGFTYSSQSRSVRASILSPDNNVVDSDVQESEEGATGPLDLSASRQDGDAFALATQSSTFESDRFTLSGRLEARAGQNNGLAESQANVVIDVTEAFNYQITLETDYEAINPDPAFGDRGSIRVVPLGDTPGIEDTIPLSRELLVEEAGGDNPAGNFNLFRSTSIQPGRYGLILDYRASSIGGNDEVADYTLTFEPRLLGPGPGGGGGEPNPIPLPPAVWSGLAVLGAGALARARTTWLTRRSARG